MKCLRQPYSDTVKCVEIFKENGKIHEPVKCDCLKWQNINKLESQILIQCFLTLLVLIFIPGLACDSVETLREMMKAGMTICRLNLAYRTHEVSLNQ